MAQQSMPNNADSNGGGQHQHQQQHQQQQQQQKHENQLLLAKPIFHDFFGAKPNEPPSAVVFGPKAAAAEPSPSASVSFGASSGGGRGPISTTSDLASERRRGNHLEGVPFYGARSDISGPEKSNKIVGSKRSNSDSTFMGSYRDGIPQTGTDSLEGSQLMKLLRNGSSGERVRRSNEEDVVFGSQQMRPCASLIFQPPSCVSKLDRSIPMNAGPAVQYPPHGGHFVPFVPQVPSNRFGDTNTGPSNISQSAADEGSRTGIKGPGILSSINASIGASERNASGAPPSASRQKGMTIISEPESSNPSSGSRHGFAGTRQMTIFYGGQAHVFDDVHPNKADVIMALAGSNGESWSTTFSPKSSVKLAGESHMPSAEVETVNASNMSVLREYRGRLSIPGTSSQGVGSSDRMRTPAGGHQVSTVATSMRNSVQAAEPTSKDKSEL